MKWIAYILSVYILALACLPCSDRGAHTTAITVSAAADNDHQDHRHGQDLCSPLCVCSCCSVQATPLQGFSWQPAFNNYAAVYPVLYINPLQSFKEPVWQPPQAA